MVIVWFVLILALSFFAVFALGISYERADADVGPWVLAFVFLLVVVFIAVLVVVSPFISCWSPYRS